MLNGKNWGLLVVCSAVVAITTAAAADVFNMPGDLTSLEMVPVGNAGNSGDVQPQGTFGAVGYKYGIARYEITSGQYCEFLNAVARVDTYALYRPQMWTSVYGCRIERTDVNSDGLWEYSVAAAYANRPVNNVCWGDAVRFCNWLHNGQPATGVQDATTTEDGAYFLDGATTDIEYRAITRKPAALWGIPSEDEWYKAAYYDPNVAGGYYWNCPTQHDTQPGRDLTEATKPGNNANYLAAPYPIEAGTYYMTEVGNFFLSDSAYGTFDQGGNVREWTDTIVGDFGVERGGSYYDTATGLLASDRQVTHGPAYESNILGFRVVAVPEPASASLLLLGAAALLRRRRG